MDEHIERARVAPGWLIGPLAATVVLFVLGLPLGFFSSGGGYLIAAVGAFWVGWGTTSLADSRHQRRNGMIVATWVIVLLCAYLLQ
jgi:hypothetical protein